MNHIVVLLFTGIHNIAVHNVRQGQGVHTFFDKGKGNLHQSITYTYMIYFIQIPFTLFKIMDPLSLT